MTTLTLDQQTALDFYSEYVNQVQYFGLTILADREERLLFRQGKKLIESVLSQKSKGSRVPYTREEVTVIVQAYLKDDNRQSVKDTFFKEFPNSGHTEDSVMFQACLLENLDNTRPGQSGTYHMTQLVEEVAQEIDSDRFSV